MWRSIQMMPLGWLKKTTCPWFVWREKSITIHGIFLLYLGLICNSNTMNKFESIVSASQTKGALRDIRSLSLSIKCKMVWNAHLVESTECRRAPKSRWVCFRRCEEARFILMGTDLFVQTGRTKRSCSKTATAYSLRLQSYPHSPGSKVRWLKWDSLLSRYV